MISEMDFYFFYVEGVGFKTWGWVWKGASFFKMVFIMFWILILVFVFFCLFFFEMTKRKTNKAAKSLNLAHVSNSDDDLIDNLQEHSLAL